MSGSRFRAPLLLFLVATAGVGLALGLRGSGPAHAVEVPTTLSGNGVDLNGQVILEPLAHPPAHGMSETAAIARARHFANRHHFPARALEASLTEPGRRHPTIENVPAWIVTFTSPTPVNVGVAGTVLVTHFSVALDATTGKFLSGFYEK